MKVDTVNVNSSYSVYIYICSDHIKKKNMAKDVTFRGGRFGKMKWLQVISITYRKGFEMQKVVLWDSSESTGKSPCN